MGCCQCEQKISISFSSPLKIMMVEEPLVKGSSYLTVSYAGFKFTGRGDIMFTLPVGNKVGMKVSYVDMGGNPAQVQNITWQSSNDAILSVVADTVDPAQCTISATGATGQVQVTANADADLGEGVKNIITIADISVVAGEAVSGTIEPVGTPEPL